MKTVLAAAAATLALAAALPALAQPAPEYVRMAGASDKFEITEARLAEQRSHNPQVLRAARMMVRDHTKSTAMVKAAVRHAMGHNPPPAMLMPAQESMLSDLRATRGRAFDRTYVDQQVQSHRQALDLHQGYAQNGDAPELRRTAAQITPVVQQHLDMWRDLQTRMR